MRSIRGLTPLSCWMIAAVVATAPIALALAGAELTAKGGKIKIQHGTPPWKDAFEAELKQGLNWRLGADAATTLTTDAGMIFEDFIVFPGEYNLALTCDRTDEYKIVFHHDGQFYGNKKTEGATPPFGAKKVEGKQITKTLVIELAKGGAQQKGYVFRITFGPHRMEAPFDTAKAKSAKGKAGTKPYTIVYLERTDVDAYGKAIEAGECCIARIERKDADPSRVYVRGGETPLLRIAPPGLQTGGSSIKGKKETAKTAAAALAVTTGDAGDGSKVTFSLGTTNYVFEIPAKTFGDAPAAPRGN